MPRPSPGRPRKYDDRVQTAFRCPPELLSAAQESAAAADISFNLWLERAMRKYLAAGGTPAKEEPATPPWSWHQK